MTAWRRLHDLNINAKWCRVLQAPRPLVYTIALTAQELAYADCGPRKRASPALSGLNEKLEDRRLCIYL